MRRAEKAGSTSREHSNDVSWGRQENEAGKEDVWMLGPSPILFSKCVRSEERGGVFLSGPVTGETSHLPIGIDYRRRFSKAATGLAIVHSWYLRESESKALDGQRRAEQQGSWAASDALIPICSMLDKSKAGLEGGDAKTYCKLILRF